MRIMLAWICVFFAAGAIGGLEASRTGGSKNSQAKALQPDASRGAAPQYTRDGRLIFPQNYREWIFLSAGLGMEYTSAGQYPGNFTNVFVPRADYQAFLQSGRWPDRTMFALEERAASSKGSINKGGHFQAELAGFGVEVKDEHRFADKWAYFSFDPEDKIAAANPKAACFDCHSAHGAAENTFVQFYPTLKPVAQKFGTYRER